MQLSGVISSWVAINMAISVFMLLQGKRRFTAALKEGVETASTACGGWYKVAYAVGFVPH
jgi:hypothetical protein